MSEQTYRDFKDRNEEYVKIKKQLELAKTKIHNLGISLEQINLRKEQLKLELKRKGLSDSERDSIKTGIKDCDITIKSIREETIQQRKIPEKVKSMIEEISRDPAIKQAVDKHLVRGYAKKVKKVQEKKVKTETLLALIQEHPSIKGPLRGMFESIKSIKELTKVLMTLDPVADHDLIDATKSNIKDKKDILDKSKAELKAFLSRNDVDIDISDIMKMTNKGYKLDGNGRIDVEKTLNRQMKGYDKQIAHFDNAIRQIDPSYSVTQQAQGQSNLPSEDIKPWQLIKRFKRWRAERKAKREERRIEESYLEESDEPEGSGTDLGDTTVIEGRDGRQGNSREQAQQKIRENIFKYDIVNDLVAQREEEYRKQAREMRRNRNNSNDRDDER